MSIKIIAIIIFTLGLVYILVPGPTQISDFPALPNSVKSNEPGDTVQVSNVTAYFSDFDRAGITNYYRKAFRGSFIFGKLIPLLTLNHPPKEAYQYVRDRQVSTFLEEYSYPLKSSLFVNGYEPYIENNILEREHNFIGDYIHVGQSDRYFKSKTTIRYYPAAWHVALVTYIGIWVASFALFKLFRKAIEE